MYKSTTESQLQKRRQGFSWREDGSSVSHKKCELWELPWRQVKYMVAAGVLDIVTGHVNWESPQRTRA